MHLHLLYDQNIVSFIHLLSLFLFLIIMNSEN
jgi:hypothetical protein